VTTITKRIGHRLPPRSGFVRRAWHYHGLSIVLFALFAFSMIGQTWSGWLASNEERRQHGEAAVSLQAYVRSGHFGEATFENFESEFLQMSFYVVLTAFLYQKGSSESKRPDVLELVDLDPRDAPIDNAPWPVRRGGVVLTLYENSLSLTFALLFAITFALHGVTGAAAFNDEQRAHGQPTTTVAAFMRTSEFWFQSFQNWQSEFVSLGAMVVLTIFLRQRGSPESKPVAAPVWETGD
jgi:hypothetical protein